MCYSVEEVGEFEFMREEGEPRTDWSSSFWCEEKIL